MKKKTPISFLALALVLALMLPSAISFSEHESSWKGKTIVWFGTSIPAGGGIGLNNQDSYPMMVGQILGATVINESIGSSCMHCKKPDLIDDSNPYGFISNRESCSRCLTNSLEEMQWIIDNAESTIWTKGLSPLEPEFVMDNSYERKLDRYLTRDSFPDLFVIDHGHNDNLNDLSTECDLYKKYDDTALYSYHGAMNFVIKRILEYNPEAKILIIGEYTRDVDDQVPQMQLEVASDWQIPIYKQWEYLGWSRTKMISLYGFWQNDGTNYNWKWVEDEEKHIMSVFNYWVPDNIHPHTNPYGKANARIAEGIAKFLNNFIP